MSIVLLDSYRIVAEEKSIIVYIVRTLAADEDFGSKHRDMLTEKTVCSAGMGTKCNGWNICVTMAGEKVIVVESA